MPKFISDIRIRKMVAQTARRLYVIRKARGFSGPALGRRARLSQAQISRIETGHQGLRSNTMFRLCDVLKVSPLVLFIDLRLARTLRKRGLGKSLPGLELIV